MAQKGVHTKGSREEGGQSKSREYDSLLTLQQKYVPDSQHGSKWKTRSENSDEPFCGKHTYMDACFLEMGLHLPHAPDNQLSRAQGEAPEAEIFP